MYSCITSFFSTILTLESLLLLFFKTIIIIIIIIVITLIIIIIIIQSFTAMTEIHVDESKWKIRHT